MANRGSCYVCEGRFPLRNMPRIGGEANAQLRNIALSRRRDLAQDPRVIDDNTRVCFTCHQSIREEIALIQRDPTCMRAKVLFQRDNNTCCLCHGRNVARLSLDCKVEIYVQCGIFLPDTVRCCPQHLDRNGYILPLLLPGLCSIKRAYNPPGLYVQRFMEKMRVKTLKSRLISDISDLTDHHAYVLTSLTKDQFDDMHAQCDRVPDQRVITRRDLLIFLTKMRQGLSDECLSAIFQLSNRQYAQYIIKEVRESLMRRFVPENIGLRAITREQYIERHITAFANQLYNPRPEDPVAIYYIDGTYTYCFKSTNFRSLRQTYCRHKSEHLVKPALVVAPDGYILDIQGPYFSDGHNNDASMLKHELENNQNLNNWFRPGDIVIVDRGYRDAIPELEALGLVCKMPPLLEAGQQQLTTADANEARLITKTRWIVESRNGHLKTMFKLLNQEQQIHGLPNIGDFIRIGGAIINRYRQTIHMENADVDMAEEMLERSITENEVQAQVEYEGLLRRDAQRWVRLSAEQVIDFPELSIEYLKHLTAGIFQIELAPSYIQDTLQRNNEQELQVEMLRDANRIPQPGFIRIRVWSRYRNITKYQIFIRYIPNGNVDDDPITGYYCTCRTGARTLGTCAHVTSILWYLGYARLQENIRFPSQALLEHIKDSADRPLEVNPL